MTPLAISCSAGDVVLFRHEGTLGDMIRAVTHSDFSHAAFGVGADALVEAHDLDGVRRTLLADYLTVPEYTRVQVRRAPGLTVSLAVAKALSMNPQPYDTWDLVRIYGYQKLGLKVLDTPTLDSEDKQVCSELDARALFAGGVDVRLQFGLVTFGLVIPGMLAESTLLETVSDWRTP